MHRILSFCKSNSPLGTSIVEGDSAMTSCKLSRNAEFQAIIPVRGKTLNCMKSSYDKIFASDIIVDLLKVIGCGVEMKSSKKAEIGNFDLGGLHRVYGRMQLPLSVLSQCAPGHRANSRGANFRGRIFLLFEEAQGHSRWRLRNRWRAAFTKGYYPLPFSHP